MNRTKWDTMTKMKACALALATTLLAQPASPAMAEVYGTTLPAGTDLAKLIENATYWSRKSKVITATIPSFDRAYDDRNKFSKHFQGITYLENGMFVAVHSLEPEPNRKCGVLAWSGTYKTNKTLKFSHKCMMVNYHPSMISSVGNIVVVTDNWDNFDEDDPRMKLKEQSRIRLFDFSSGSPRELTHQTLYGHSNTVAITYNRKAQQYFLVTANPADFSDQRLTVYSSQLRGGRPCTNLRDPKCKLRRVDTPKEVQDALGLRKGQSWDKVLASSSGGGLISQADGTMRFMAFYSPNQVAADFAGVSHVTYSKRTVLAVQMHKGEDLGFSQFEAKTRRPSCRWGCALVMRNSKLYFVLIARDVWSDEFEIGLYQVWPKE